MNAAYLEKPLADIVLSLYDSCLQKYFFSAITIKPHYIITEN